MANYLITYTISDDDVRASIKDFIKGLGENQEVDQSTIWVNFSGTKEKLITGLEAARKEYQMGKNDVLKLFYAGLNKNNDNTILKKEIN